MINNLVNNSLALAVCVVLLLSACASDGSKKPAGEGKKYSSVEELSEWRIKADDAYREKDYKTALENYKKIAEVLSSEAEIWFRIGNTYNRMGDIDNALIAYREVLVRDPSYSKAWYNSGLIQLKKAAQIFHESTQYLKPHDPVYDIATEASADLLEIVNNSNRNIAKAFDRNEGPKVNPNKVEVIILDNKSTPRRKQSGSRDAAADMDEWFAPLKMENLIKDPNAN